MSEPTPTSDPNPTQPADTTTAPRRTGLMLGRVTAVSLVVLLAAGAALAAARGLPKALLGGPAGGHGLADGARDEHRSPGEPKPATATPGLVAVDPKDAELIGVKVVAVEPQTRPIVLELSGRTAYDPNSITKIRPRFDTRVEKVFAELGQSIKKGDPLVELYSTDLASAKTDFQTKYVQWQHDSKLYNLRQKLVETGAISQQLWVDTQNDEQKSRLFFNIALDKLAVFYEVPKEEIDPLLEHLSDKTVDLQSFGSVSDKARMTMRAKTDGVVIAREVVPGNYYETTDVLMEVAQLDRLWVWVNIFELDQEKVSLGQTMRIEFPFLSEKMVGKVDYVAPEVSRDTRAVKVRATIPNPSDRFKSDMLVRAHLEIPPVPGQTVIPRVAMVSMNGSEYVFVHKGEQSGGPDTYERRAVEVAQEKTDHVVLRGGLKAGEKVVATGSLILSQLYEDQRVTETGQPAP